MGTSLAHVVVRRILDLILLLTRGDRSKEIEIWSCATKSRYCIGRSPAQIFAPPTGPGWPGGLAGATSASTGLAGGAIRGATRPAMARLADRRFIGAVHGRRT
jgi:hypothetical protein